MQPTQRGSVSWERLGIKVGHDYVVELCESFEGARYTQFRNADEEPSDPHYMTETEAIDGTRLMEFGLNDYVNRLFLKNGDAFSFGADGQWMTTASYERLSDRKTPVWSGGTSNLLSHQAACDAASDHGKTIGLAAFTVIDAILLDEKGSPVWHVILEFDNKDDDDWIAFSPVKSVQVDAVTGAASSIMSL